MIGLEVLDNGRCFLVQPVAMKDENLIYKYRRTRETKTTVYIFIHKIFRNSFLKSYIAIRKWRRVIAKWGYCKVKPLQSDIVFPYLQLFPIRFSWEFKQYIPFTKFLTYSGNKYIDKCFFDLHWKYCPRSSHWLCKLRPQAIFSGKDRKKLLSY